jgi:hypothetical protein
MAMKESICHSTLRSNRWARQKWIDFGPRNWRSVPLPRGLHRVSRPVAAAALEIPDLALIFSAYCNGNRVDLYRSACVIPDQYRVRRSRGHR